MSEKIKEETISDSIKAEIVSLTKKIIQDLTGLFKEETKNYGYLFITDWSGKVRLDPTEIGNVPAEKKEKYNYLSREKAERLCMEKEHLTSYESRDPKEGKYGKWGGAIIAGLFILSFSGLSEYGDEAVVSKLAIEMNLVYQGYITKIKNITGNPYLCEEFLSSSTLYPI